MQDFTVAPGARLVIAVPSALVSIKATSEPGRISVDVAPAHAGRGVDQRTAERISVEGSKDVVSVLAPTLGLFGINLGTAVITVEVPPGTEIQCRTGNGSVRVDGAVGHAQVHSSNGSLTVDRALTLRADTSNGPVYVGSVEGEVELTTSSGEVHLGASGGRSTVKSSNGALTIGRTGSPLSAKTSNGSITLGVLSGEARLRTSLGAIRVDRVEGGRLDAATSMGEVDLAVAPGVAVWVDAQSKSGSVLNELASTSGPATESTAELRATTSMGALRLRRLQEGPA